MQMQSGINCVGSTQAVCDVISNTMNMSQKLSRLVKTKKNQNP